MIELRALIDLQHRVCLRWLAGVLLSTLSLVLAAEPERNGFDLAGSLVPVEEIHHGGPPRDGIPSIDDPQFVTSAEAELAPDAWVLGIERGGLAKAYPLAILNWHEVVNDRFGREPLAVTFCPLCGTGMAFRAEVHGSPRQFGVSGLLYNSDVLLYDRESESLWSQIGRQAISGPARGSTLEMLPVSHTTWADWRERHPDTLVLSEETGHQRNYAHNPYQGYEQSTRTYFPVAHRDSRYHPKERVIGIELNGVARAWPFSELALAQIPLDDQVGSTTLRVEFDAEHRNGRVLDVSGAEVPTVIAFWFAWAAFHPETEVYTAAQ